MALVSLFECVTAVIPVSFLVFSGSGSHCVCYLSSSAEGGTLLPSRARNERSKEIIDRPLFSAASILQTD